ncbi:MAG: exo-alpha-sialidase, partial [Phycisphaerae bacterium]|nr:exo-alpha-sialidase [Phycisphaerae bacterium]
MRQARAALRRVHTTVGGVSLLACALLGCTADMAATLDDVMELVFNIGQSAPLVAAGESVFVDRPIFQSIPDKIGSHAATITAFDNGELLAAWYSHTGPHELTGSAIYMARRPAGADEWSEPQLHIDRATGDGNPVLYGEGDRVWLFQAVIPLGWSTAHIETQMSEDRGSTWSAAQTLPGPLGANVRYPPVRLASGELLLPAYDDLLQRALFYVSADGQEWTQRAALVPSAPHSAIQPAIA